MSTAGLGWLLMSEVGLEMHLGMGTGAFLWGSGPAWALLVLLIPSRDSVSSRRPSSNFLSSYSGATRAEDHAQTQVLT